MSPVSEIERLQTGIALGATSAYAHKKLGDEYFAQGHLAAALSEYKKILSFTSRLWFHDVVLRFHRTILRHPQDIPLRLTLVELYQAAEHYEDAADELSEILEMDPANIKALNLAIAVCVHSESKTSIVPLLEKAVDHALDDPTLLNVLTSHYLEQGDVTRALSVYERVLQLRPHDADILATAAELQVRAKNFSAAAGYFDLLLRENQAHAAKLIPRLEAMLAEARPDEQIKLHYVLAKAYCKDLKPDKAMASYHLIVERSPSDRDTILQSIKDLLITFPDFPEAYMLLAKILVQTKNYSEAVALYNKVVHLHPQKYAEDAIVGYNSVLEECPNQALALQSIGELYMAKHDLPAAVDKFRILLGLTPEASDYVIDKCKKILRTHHSSSARHLLGTAYLLKKNFKQALEEGEYLIKHAPDVALGYALVGETYLAMNKTDTAVEVLSNAVKRDPYQKEILIHFEKARRGRIAAQAAQLEARTLQQQERSDIRFMYGQKLFLLREIDRTIPELQAVLKDQTYARAAHILLGMAFKEKGRYDLASVQFQQALEGLDSAVSVEDRLKLLLYRALAEEAFGRISIARELYEKVLLENNAFLNAGMRFEMIKNVPNNESRGQILVGVLPFEGADTCIACNVHNRESDTFEERQMSPISFSVEHNDHGVEHILKKRTGEALKDLKVSTSLDKGLTAAHNNLGVIALQEKKWAEAEEHFKRALYCNQQLGAVFANIGVLHHLQGAFDKAERAYNDALSLDDSLQVVQINLGDILFQKGNVADALIYWRRARELSPLPELAERRLMWKINE